MHLMILELDCGWISACERERENQNFACLLPIGVWFFGENAKFDGDVGQPENIMTWHNKEISWYWRR